MTFVETDRAAAETIVRNLDKLGLDGRRPSCAQDVARKLAADARPGRRYDLVLIDPPYRMLAAPLPTLDRLPAAVVARRRPRRRRVDAREEPELPLPKRTSRRYGVGAGDALRGRPR